MKVETTPISPREALGEFYNKLLKENYGVFELDGIFPHVFIKNYIFKDKTAVEIPDVKLMSELESTTLRELIIHAWEEAPALANKFRITVLHPEFPDIVILEVLQNAYDQFQNKTTKVIASYMYYVDE